MTFAIPSVDLGIDISDEYITDLIIENHPLFCDVLMDLSKQINGNDGSIIIANNDKILNLSRSAELIWNPITIDMNSSKMIKKLYQALQEELLDLEDEVAELNTQIVCFLDVLLGKLPYNLESDCAMDIQSLCKAYKVQFALDESTIADLFLDYIKTVHQLCGIDIFVTVNLKDYFNDSDLAEIYKSILYEKVILINISNSEKGDCESEKRYIIDSDLCFINMN